MKENLKFYIGFFVQVLFFLSILYLSLTSSEIEEKDPGFRLEISDQELEESNY